MKGSVHISTTERLLAIKPGKVVTYYKTIPPIKSNNPLKTWSFEIMPQIKNFLSPLSQGGDLG